MSMHGYHSRKLSASLWAHFCQLTNNDKETLEWNITPESWEQWTVTQQQLCEYVLNHLVDIFMTRKNRQQKTYSDV